MEPNTIRATAILPQADILTRAETPPKGEDPPVEGDAATRDDTDTQTRSETNREIRGLVERGNLASTVADGLIDRGVSVEEARREILDIVLAQPRPADQIRTAHIRQVGPSGDDPTVVMERCIEALHARVSPNHKPSEEARQYVGYTPLEMIRALAVARGDARASTAPLASFMARATHGASDFPVLLQGTGNRVLLEAFEQSASAIKGLARQITNPDFRTRTVAKIGEMSRLEKVAESGEITSTTRAEAKEAWRLDTYAQMISITRQAIVNDDLGAFTDTLNAMAQAAADTEAWLLVELITANGGAGPTLDDGKALFHADHGNLGTAAALDIDPLTAARLAMRRQTGVGGALITVAPRFLLVPPDLETQAEKIIATLQPATMDQVNVFSQRLEVVVEPRLTDPTAYFLFADPGQAPVLEYGYLASAPGPQLETQQGWEVLGTSFRCFLDFGAGVVDHRGAHRNPGA